jgi:ankyrin repeat domain-containing protein 50
MDPLSAVGAAGSAVSFMSPGIQVCQGLLGYYASLKDARADIRRMYNSVERLEGSLKQLAKASSSDDAACDQDMVAEAKDNTAVLNDALKDLKEELDKIKLTPEADGDAWEKLKASGRKALYPFRESTLIKLKEIVDDSLAHLNLILNALQL